MTDEATSGMLFPIAINVRPITEFGMLKVKPENGALLHENSFI